MIKLDVLKYCHGCPKFEAITSRGGEDTYVECKYKDVCCVITDHVERAIRRELNHDQDRKS